MYTHTHTHTHIGMYVHLLQVTCDIVVSFLFLFSLLNDEPFLGLIVVTRNFPNPFLDNS